MSTFSNTAYHARGGKSGEGSMRWKAGAEV